jgi:phospholipase C
MKRQKRNGRLRVSALALAASAVLQAQSTTTPIKHVVVIFQENVSFDHYFATYPYALNPGGQPVFVPSENPFQPTPTVNGLADGMMTNNPNSAQPFRLDRSEAVTCDQDHDYTHEQQAFNGGLMNKFVETVAVATPACDSGHGKSLVMGYYDGNTVTAFWNYAQHFAMSDNHFNTVFGPSTPGAINLISGQTHGATVTNDAGSAATQVVADSITGDARPAYDDCSLATQNQVSMSGQNVGDLLNKAGVSWGWFQGGFTPSSRKADGSAVCATAHANIAGISTSDYIMHHQPFQYYKSTSNQHHLPPTSVAMIGKTDQANHQYDITDFFRALDAGNMPAVSYLKAPGYQDGHPGYSDPLDEQTFIVNTINRLMQSPEWDSTAVFIDYDDSDGWYDHVMPPIMSQSNTALDALTGPGACGAAADGAYQGRCGFGPRTPFLLISRFAKVNYVDHTTSDQSSTLKFIEDNWGLGRIGDQSFDATAGSVMQMFEFQDGGHASKLFLDPQTGQPQ